MLPNQENQKHPGTKLSSARLAASTTCSVTPIIDSMPNFDIDADSTEQPTILGNQRTNPYTIANMKQAYTNLGLSGMTVNVTNLYVRFLPNSGQQLATLDSILDSQGLDLFDTPMDYDVLQEGDYYQDPSIPDTSITWQYAVVPANFVFPSGINYQTLSQIHIPGDAYSAVETEGERLASIQDSINCSGGGVKAIVPYVPYCGPGYHWDFTLGKCVCDCCPPGYQWNGTQCVPIPPPPPNPPPPSPDAQIPAGTITVSDINFGNYPGVRNVRIVAKRWFKIERTYTDNNGYFQCTKHFKHRVKINVKFKNNDAVVKRFRLTKFWQMFYPITKTIGVYSSNKNSIAYIFKKYNTSIADKGNLYWAAATTDNAVQEYKDYATSQQTGLPPGGLKIFLTRWANGSGMTPMWNKRWYSDLPQEAVIRYFLYTVLPPAASITNIYTMLKHELDMGISYQAPGSDYSVFYSDNLKTTIYHELTHSTHYAALGNGWYTSFVNAEVNEIVNTLGSSSSPYGDGSDATNSPIIALGESWAYHMGNYFADKRYGMSSSAAGEQGTTYPNNYLTGLSSHQIALEIFTPGKIADPFHWIPKGVYYDLIDNGEPSNITGVTDQVAGFTNQQFFNAFNSSITSIQGYKQNFMQQNPNNQQQQILNLFSSYAY